MRGADGYAPIEDYAAIGDGRTVALVALDGSIDWLALPRLDSHTVFARLLDAARGGAFELSPATEYEVARRYLEGSNVLETTFTTPGGRVRVTDAVTLDHGGLLPWFELARRVEGIDGSVPMRWSVTPRLAAGEDEQPLRIGPVREAVVVRGRELVLVVEAFDAGETESSEGRGEICGRFTTSPGSDGVIVLRATHDEPVPLPRRDWVERRVAETADDWRRWLDDAAVPGEWVGATRRSALVLRLLTYVPTGAIAAAATTSLPERIGGDRNYDYRFAWVRDTAFTLDALINLDLLVQVHASFAWLLEAVGETHPGIDVVYDLDGREVEQPTELDLDGYRGSRPVLRGNRAARQLQLGCYGDLLETAELYVREGNAFDDTTAARLVETMNRLGDVWTEKDSGIWELPETEHYTSSKLAAWMAYDRALRLVDAEQLPADHVADWRATADEIRAFVESECWSDERGAYVMHAGSERLDASVLRVSRMNYLETRGERFRSTIDAIRAELGAGGPLLYRYSGQQEAEGAFVACSFWLVEALARAGRLDDARSTMRELVALANDVGLFAEEIDPDTHAFLGNFPQGLSHLALVNAAAAIAESEG